MIRPRRRAATAVSLAVALAVGAVACDRPSVLPRAKSGARCATDGAFARNATHVLQCKKNRRWTAIMPIGQAESLYVNFVLNPPTAAPPSTAAPSVGTPPPTAAPPVTPPLVTAPTVTAPPTTAPPIVLPGELQPEIVRPGSPAPQPARVALDGVSGDGRFVLTTLADVVGGPQALYLVDRVAGTTTRIASAGSGVMSSTGEWVGVITPDQLVAGDTDSQPDAYRWRRSTGEFTRISFSAAGTAPDRPPSRIGGISDDGRYVSYTSFATDVVAGDTNDAPDVFVRDITAGTNVRANVTSAGAQANDSYYPIWSMLSASGRYVVFSTTATNLRPDDTDADLDVFRHDLVTGATVPVTAQHSDPVGSGAGYYAMASDGDRILVDEGNGPLLVTMSTGTRVHPTGAPANHTGDSYGGSIAVSPNGRFLAYGGWYTGRSGTGPALVVTDLQAGETRLVDYGYVCDTGYGRFAADQYPGMFVTDSGRPSCNGDTRYAEPTDTAGLLSILFWPSPF